MSGVGVYVVGAGVCGSEVCCLCFLGVFSVGECGRLRVLGVCEVDLLGVAEGSSGVWNDAGCSGGVRWCKSGV